MSADTAIAVPTAKELTFSLLDKARSAIADALTGSVVPVDRFIAVARQAYLTNPTPLHKCEPSSVVRCLLQIAALQLSPDPRVGDAYLIPRKNRDASKRANREIVECTLLTGYQGMAKRMRRNPTVHHLDADVVYENDHFVYEKGASPKLEHRPTTGERGRIVASYAVAHFQSGPPLFWVCMRADIDAAKARSQQPDKAWKTDEGPMAMKTALRRLHKLIPCDDLWRAQMDYEESIEREDSATSVRQLATSSDLLDGLDEPFDDGSTDEENAVVDAEILTSA